MNEQIQLMIDWIEDNLKNQFSLDELSNYMGYSPYYCSFKFHQVTGISIRRYILLRRLYLSAEDLANNRKIIDVAFDYDYSSQEAYSRAFKLFLVSILENIKLTSCLSSHSLNSLLIKTGNGVE